MLGASSLVAGCLIDELLEAGFEVVAVSRHTEEQGRTREGLEWRVWGVGSEIVPPDHGTFYCISLLPLWLLPPLITHLSGTGLRRLIAFSSTSVITKANSAATSERELAQRLLKAERELASICAGGGLALTIFRPTLIYGGGRDENVSQIARFIERFGFFPLVGEGRGIRQPVHAGDLARACVLALDQPRTYGRTYALSGGESLTYRELVERVFRSLQRPSRFIHLPESLARLALAPVGLLPAYRHVNAQMLIRMNRDLSFDHSEASEDFGYKPRGLDLADAPWAAECDTRRPRLC